MDRTQIIALAPDAASVKAADKLTTPGKWPLLAFHDRAIWGHCKGSGSTPYQTRIDRQGSGFKCSCPSRKFPCKHGVALYLLFAEEHAAFSEQAEAPDWVSEWLEGRDSRAEKKATRAASDKPVDEKAQAKRRENREQKVKAGVEELSLWLADIARTGFAELPGKPYRYWMDLAARMVDAQAPGLAGRMRSLGNLVARGDDPMPQLAAELAGLHLLLKAYGRIDELAPQMQAELRAQVGIPVPEALVLKEPAVVDDWQVLERCQVEEENLVRQESWLLGRKEQRFAKVLQFAHPTQVHGLALNWGPGDVLSGAMHFYPGMNGLRVLPGEFEVRAAGAQAAPTLADPLTAYAEQSAANPWLGTQPMIISQLTPVSADGRQWLADGTRVLPCSSSRANWWRLLALSAGSPLAVFGEWDGRQLRLLGAWLAESYHSLQMAEAPA